MDETLCSLRKTTTKTSGLRIEDLGQPALVGVLLGSRGIVLALFEFMGVEHVGNRCAVGEGNAVAYPIAIVREKREPGLVDELDDAGFESLSRDRETSTSEAFTGAHGKSRNVEMVDGYPDDDPEFGHLIDFHDGKS